VTPAIQTEIAEFEALQKSFEKLGAEDSDSDAVFHMVIAVAINRDPVDIDKPIDWDLYENDDEMRGEDRIDPIAVEIAQRDLTAQGWKVYRAIQAHATEADIAELKKYAWRVDREEFEPGRY
jgi:hypothetical protein